MSMGESNGRGGWKLGGPCIIHDCREYSQHRSQVCETHRTKTCVRCLKVFRLDKWDEAIARKPRCGKCRALERREV